MSNGGDTVVEHPTYLEHIRHFFDDFDIVHMLRFGIDLATYEGVKFNALRIFIRTNEDTMPPEPARRWSDARKKTFYNWLRDECPRGTATPVRPSRRAATVSRVRKDIAALSEDEIALLKQAFQGMMDRDDDDPQSYFAIAGLHWLPGPDVYCRHHENAYNPWHRAYLQVFEDALRSVPGCESVTLPYWDITAEEIPSVLYEAPFDSYTIKPELCPLVGPCYGPNYATRRNDISTLQDEIKSYGITANIDEALGHSHWERFNGWDAGRTQDGIIRAHDNGHNAGGPTLANQDVAAFEPLFWFFHANWDRLWWKWQEDYQATTLTSFKSTLLYGSKWLDDPVINKIPPFNYTTAQTIDLESTFDATYVHPSPDPVRAVVPRFGRMSAAQPVGVSKDRLSVRLSSVDRLAIPGSFVVNLYGGDQLLGRQGFFQSTHPKHCETCRKNAVVSFDFDINYAELADEPLRAEVLLRNPDGTTSPFPLALCGNPTLNVRLLLD